MKRLEVRCCCNPAIVFGTVPVPDWACAGSTVRVALRRPMPAIPASEPPTSRVADDFLYLEVAEFQHVGNGPRTLAVKSNDRPIEVFRRVVGFEENK